MIKILLTICFALFSQLAGASYFAQNNVSTVLQRNADLLNTGDVQVDLSVFADGYKSGASSTRDTDGFVYPGIAYGMNERLSVGFMAPVAVVGQNNSGVRGLNTTAKYLLGGSYNDGVVVTLSGYVDVYGAPSSKGLGSSESGYGLLMNISLLGDTTNLNFSFGGEKSDIKSLNGGSTYSSQQQLILAGSLEYRHSDQWKYLLDGFYTRTNNLDDNFLLMPGVRFSPNNKINFYLGAGLGLPSDTSIPEWRTTAGVAVNFGHIFSQTASFNPLLSGKQLVSTTKMSDSYKPVTQLSTPVAVPTGLLKVSSGGVDDSASNISPADALLLQQIEALRGEVGKLINTPPNVIARIEIQNASGVRGLGERVAKLLASRGYSVVSISDIAKRIDRPTRIYYQGGAKNAEIVRIDQARLGVLKQTRIYFIEGFQQRATRVSMTLPGSQRVMPDVELVNAAEIRIVIGKDMKALLQKRSPRHLPEV